MILFQLAKGMLVSIEIFALTLLFSLPLGLVVAFGRMAKNVVLRSVTKAYISIMRGTPLMLQLLIIYFGPSILFKVKIGPGYRFVAVILAFSINYAAYFAEIYRSGIESMPVGQYEAAKVLGYNWGHLFQDYPAAGDQEDFTVRHQRNHYAGKGYFPGICHCTGGNVYHCQADCGKGNHNHAAYDCRRVLLYFQPDCGGCNGKNRESVRIL